MPITPMSVLVLGGRRGGHIDPLASGFDVSDKCLVPVNGRPMISHVLETLHSISEITRIIASVHDPEILRPLPIVELLENEKRIEIIRSSRDLLSSIVESASQADFPLLITTADNVFLSRQSIAEIANRAAASNAAAAVAFARREDVLREHPAAQRKFYTFSDGGFSNCNSYWLANRTALGVASAFKGGGQFAKHPLRIVNAFGLCNLIRLRFGIGTLDDAFRAVSRRFGTKIVPVILTDGKCAIDVDNDRTHQIAEMIMQQSKARAATVAGNSEPASALSNG